MGAPPDVNVHAYFAGQRSLGHDPRFVVSRRVPIQPPSIDVGLIGCTSARPGAYHRPHHQHPQRPGVTRRLPNMQRAVAPQNRCFNCWPPGSSVRACSKPKDQQCIERNQSAWFKAKGVDRPACTMLAVNLLSTDRNTFEIGEVVVVSALLATASLAEYPNDFEGYVANQEADSAWDQY